MHSDLTRKPVNWTGWSVDDPRISAHMGGGSVDYNGVGFDLDQPVGVYEPRYLNDRVHWFELTHELPAHCGNGFKVGCKRYSIPLHQGDYPKGLWRI